MESKKIKNSQLSCYTYQRGWGPQQGRLNNNRAWCSSNNDATNEYFEIDLLKVRHVSAIATQGVSYTWLLKYYVETYRIKYSYDGRSWLSYKNIDDTDMVCYPICVLNNIIINIDTLECCYYNHC